MTSARLLAAALSASTLTGCTAAPTPSPEPSAAQPADGQNLMMTPAEIEHGGIRWMSVQSETMTETTQVPGHLAPDEDRTVRLSAPARARVVVVHVRAGERVSRGEVLVTLQGAEAATVRAEHAKAMADLKAHDTSARYARDALARAERLLELKAMSRQDVERARVENDEREAMRAQAEVEVERTRVTLTQLGIDSLTGDMVLRTPLAGFVLSRDVVPGSVVDAGALLVTVSDPTTLWLEIAATEALVPAIRAGTRVTFTVPEYVGEMFVARIESVGAALDPATRTLPVHGLVRNPAGMLRPAMFATVQLTVGAPRDGVVVPEPAMQLLDGRPVVFVAYPDGRGGARFERRDVELGSRERERIQIVRGVSRGDLVVTEGAYTVKSRFSRSSVRPS